MLSFPASINKITQEHGHKNWYLAGPMAGLPENNYPQFNAVTARLRSFGMVISCPTEGGLPHNSEWHEFLRQDLMMLLTCYGVILLPGWTTSNGTRLELSTATAIKMPVLLYNEHLGLVSV